MDKNTKLAPAWHLSNSGGVDPSVVGSGVVLTQLGGYHVVFVCSPQKYIMKVETKYFC